MFEQRALRTGLMQFTYKFDSVTREDIYRQRVLGTDSGMGHFIKVDDKRKLGSSALLIYLVFIGLTIGFIYTRIDVLKNYHVNDIISRAVQHTPYDLGRERDKTWNDITSIDDATRWLLVALPTLVTPTIRNFNMPMGSIRFTVRRIQSDANSDPRFGSLAPHTWSDKNGIDPRSTNSEFEAKDPFGGARKWIFDGPGNKPALQWSQTDNARCSAGEVMMEQFYKGEKLEIQAICKKTCEQMMEPATCVCFTISGTYTCKYYMISLAMMGPKIPSDSEEGVELADQNVIVPPALREVGTTMWYPRIERFTYSNAHKGYMGTNGYLSFLPLNTAQQNEFLPEVVLYNQITDWLKGEMASNDTGALSVDFVTYNPNYEVFSWIQITFKVHASGSVVKSTRVMSLFVPNKVLRQSHTTIFTDLNVSGYLYILLVACYCGLELWEILQVWFKYFRSFWNLLSLATVVLNVVTIFAYSNYLENQSFVKNMRASQGQAITDFQAFSESITHDFSFQVEKFNQFITISSFTLLFIFINLLRFINESVPRVKVLIDTMYFSLAPILFLCLIIAISFVGFSVMANVTFGRTSKTFAYLEMSVSALVQMLFGKVEFFAEINEVEPGLGFSFFVVFILVYYFVLTNFPRAVVITSYGDSCEYFRNEQQSEESRKRAKESDNSGGWGLVFFRKIKQCFSIASQTDRDASLKKAEEAAIQTYEVAPFKITNVFLFLIHVILWIAFIFLAVDVTTNQALKSMIDKAITTPNFDSVIGVTGQTQYQGFHTVSSQEDVGRYLREALPMTMFNTSKGTFAGKPNPLATHWSALPSVYDQLVIGNWNIVIGQKPVRLTLRFFDMEQAGDSRFVNGAVSKTDLLRKKKTISPGSTLDGIPSGDFIEATQLSQIRSAESRNALEKWCAYKTGWGTDNAFSCILSVNQTLTQNILNDMSKAITNQTATLVVDFVVYNGFVELFAYVNVIFDFLPSGSVSNKIYMEMVPFELYNSAADYIRTVCEAFLILFAVIHTIVALSEICGAARGIDSTEGRRKKSQQTFILKIILKTLRSIQAVALHCVGHPATVLDLVSSILILLNFVFWYSHILSPFCRDYFALEIPVWNSGTCSSAKWTWCSDEDVLNQFFKLAANLRITITLFAINALLLFFRLIKYLQYFQRVHVILNTFYRGVEDIAWFVLVLFLFLTGYVLMANLLFGSNIGGLSSVGSGYLYCFAMFLGEFDYNALNDVGDGPQMQFFFFTYMIIFRFIMINMFLAVINNNFKTEEENRCKAYDRVMMEKSKQNTAPSRPGWSLLGSIKFWRSGFVTDPSNDEALDAVATTAIMDDDAAPEGNDRQIEGLNRTTSETVLKDSGNGEAVPTLQLDRRDGLQRDQSTDGSMINTFTIEADSSWHILPDDVREWATRKTSELHKYILESVQERKTIEKEEATELDRCMEDLEGKLKKMRDASRHDAKAVEHELQREQLSKLRQVHQDQESLSWYIMKREKELRSLEKTKDMQQEQLDKMLKAAKALINEEVPALDEGS